MLSLTQPVKVLDLTKSEGRLFLMGDIHGQMDLFMRLLERNQFSDKDQLILVGDLLDRGEGSLRVLDYILEHDNIHTTLGNHEEMVAYFYHQHLTQVTSLMQLREKEHQAPRLKEFIENYGFWLHGLMREDWGDLHALMPCLNDLPLALDIRAPGNIRIGVVHADCPIKDFNSLLMAIMAGHEQTLHDIIWSRRLAEPIQDWCEDHLEDSLTGIQHCTNPAILSDPLCHIDNVDLVVHGHTIMPYPILARNRLYLDTGGFSCFGRLSLLEVQGSSIALADSAGLRE